MPERTTRMTDGDLKVTILNEKRGELCKCLEPQDHFIYLRQCYMLSEDDEEIIRSELTRRLRASKMLDILITKGPKAYDELVESILRNRTQVFLATLLNRDFEEKQKKLKEYEARMMEREFQGSSDNNNSWSQPASTYPLSLEKQNSVSEKDSSRVDLGFDSSCLPVPVLQSMKSVPVENSIDTDSQCGSEESRA